MSDAAELEKTLGTAPARFADEILERFANGKLAAPFRTIRSHLDHGFDPPVDENP